MALYETPAHNLHKLIIGKKISVQELVLSFFQRIEKVEDKIKAFLYLDREEALEEAKGWDEKLSLIHI